MTEMIFVAWDWVIMAATMVGSVAIGLYFRFSGGKQKTNEVKIHRRRISVKITCFFTRPVSYVVLTGTKLACEDGFFSLTLLSFLRPLDFDRGSVNFEFLCRST